MTTYSSSKRGHYNNEQVVFEDTKLTSSITPQNEHKTLPYQINLKWFKCKFCDTIFYDNFDKLIHTRQMHQAEEEEQQQLLNSATPSNSEKVIQDVPLQRINSEKNLPNGNYKCSPIPHEFDTTTFKNNSYFSE